jgi:hypothetical protein
MTAKKINTNVNFESIFVGFLGLGDYFADRNLAIEAWHQHEVIPMYTFTLKPERVDGTALHQQHHERLPAQQRWKIGARLPHENC